MATYKALRGLTIRTVAGDPSPLITGDIWYSSTAKKIRGAKAAAGSWSTAPALNQIRNFGGASNTGTVTAGLVFGGAGTTTASTAVDNAESYDGSSWTEGPDLQQVNRNMGSFGTSTAAMSCGGTISAEVEQWNGTAWTEVGNLTTGRTSISGAGTVTAGLCAGGTNKQLSEEWNGTGWTEGDDLNEKTNMAGSCGIQTAALSIGGWIDPGNTTHVEEYDGSSWAEIADCNTGRQGQGATGTVDDAIVFGGDVDNCSTYYGNTEVYDGTSWTEIADLNVARGSGVNGIGTDTAALAAGGATGPQHASTNNVEEWDASPIAASSFTSS